MDEGMEAVVETPKPQPKSVIYRIMHFPLTRIIIAFVLVGLLPLIFGGMAMKGGRVLGWPDTIVGMLDVLVLLPAAWWGYRLYIRLLENNRGITELDKTGINKELAGGIIIGAGLFVVIISTLWALGYYQVNSINAWTTVLPYFWISVKSGFWEELITRGIMFRIIEEKLGSWIAMAITALLFGFAHASNPSATMISNISITLTAGVLLALGYMLTRRLWLVIGIHFAWNFTQGGIFGMTVSGIDMGGLLNAELNGPEWLTGGAFGPEASVLTVCVVSVVSLWMLIKTIQRGHVVQPFWKARPTEVTEI
jgi:uncharacterized protein